MATNDYNVTEKKKYCSQCGRQMIVGASTQGDYRYCYHGEKLATGTLDRQKTIVEYPKPMSGKEIRLRFLIDRRNAEIKRAWKRDQYAKVRGQFRI